MFQHDSKRALRYYSRPINHALRIQRRVRLIFNHNLRWPVYQPHLNIFPFANAFLRPLLNFFDRIFSATAVSDKAVPHADLVVIRKTFFIFTPSLTLRLTTAILQHLWLIVDIFLSRTFWNLALLSHARRFYCYFTTYLQLSLQFTSQLRHRLNFCPRHQIPYFPNELMIVIDARK